MGFTRMPYRNFYCEKYSECLKQAAIKNKKNLGCATCKTNGAKPAGKKGRKRQAKLSGIEELERLIRLRDEHPYKSSRT